jgi:hypothetical protein
MVYIGLLTVVGLWAAGQGRWALFLLLLICYFD